MKPSFTLAALAAATVTLAATRPAQAQTFASEALQDAARAIDTFAEQTHRETERLRLAMAYDPAAALALQPDGARAILATALATGAGAGDVRARWFMAGAIVQPGRDGATRLYNPLARGWLVLDWARGAEGKPTLTGARLTSAGGAPWASRPQRYLAALRDDYQRERQAVGTAPPGTVLAEADRWLIDLAAWAAPTRAETLAGVRRILAEGAVAALGGHPFDLLPRRVRASFLPVGAFVRSKGGPAVLFGSPLLPSLLVAADFRADAPDKLDRLTVLNLDSAGERP